MTYKATGNFEVKMQPQGDGNIAEGSSLGRMSLDKQFSGDLQAVGARAPASELQQASDRVRAACGG